MYFANFALSLLKTCSRLKVVEEEIQEPEDVRDLPVFIFLSLFIHQRLFSIIFFLHILQFLRLNNHSIINLW